jgi:hypothetical protein
MVSLGILFYVTRWDYFMHNPLAPINWGIVVGHSSGSAAPTSWVGDKFEFAASARAAWLDYICLANQTGVLTTHGHDIVVDTVLSLLFSHSSPIPDCRFRWTNKDCWCAYAPIILFLLSTFLNSWLPLCTLPFSTLTSMCRRNFGIEPRNAGVYA